jgi:endonuclease/exonuclease/phosphatase family metal-dependent hydrolase
VLPSGAMPQPEWRALEVDQQTQASDHQPVVLTLA